MTKTLRFVKWLGVIYRVLLETPAGCWLIDCNGPSPPFFEADLHKYERVPAPESWMTEQQTMTPAQKARLKLIQPLLDCDDCISDKSLRYKMAADAAQQYQTTQAHAGNNSIGQFGLHFGANNNVSTSNKRERVVKPEEISNLSQNEFFMLDRVKWHINQLRKGSGAPFPALYGHFYL